MGKIYLFYKKHNDSLLGDILKVKIDDNITAEVNKFEIYELLIADGNHNLKMYHEGWTSDELVGYIDQNVEINGDTYLMYEGPATVFGKGKLTIKKFNSPDEFKKYSKKVKTIKMIIGIILFLVALLIVIFL